MQFRQKVSLVLASPLSFGRPSCKVDKCSCDKDMKVCGLSTEPTGRELCTWNSVFDLAWSVIVGELFQLLKNVFFGLETSKFASTCKMCRQWLRLIRRAGWLAPPRNMAAHANYAKITILQQKTCVIIQQHVCQQYWASVEMFYQNIP